MVDLKKMAAALGLPDTATETEILTAATAVKAELSTKNTELTALKSGMVDAAIKEGEAKGLITDANRDSFKVMLSSNFSATKQIIDAVKLPENAANTEGVTTTTTLKAVLDSNAKTVEPAKVSATESFDYLQRHETAKLASIKEKEPEKYKQLIADYAKGVRHKA